MGSKSDFLIACQGIIILCNIGWTYRITGVHKWNALPAKMKVEFYFSGVSVNPGIWSIATHAPNCLKFQYRNVPVVCIIDKFGKTVPLVRNK